MKMNRENITDEVVEFILTLPDGKVGMLTVDRIVDKFKISRSNLYKQFKKSKNFTLQNFINQQKIWRTACILRTDKQAKIRRLSEQMGFCNCEYFIRVFKSYLGVTPGRYKKLFSNEKNF